MDFYDVINTRRSIRKFSRMSIPEDIVIKIMTAAGMAPSGSNRQNWKYILIKDKHKQQQLVELCSNQSFIGEAPIIVVVCGKDMSSAYNRGGYMGKLGMLMDVSITFTHFMLAARAEGLGTCWVGYFDNDKIKELLEVPDGWEVAAISPLGYPQFNDVFHEQVSRIGYDELVSEESFKEPYYKDDFDKMD